MQPKIEIQNSSKNDDVPPEPDIRSWIEAVLENQSSDSGVSVKVVDEREIQRLNSCFRSKDQATNVLSFPAELPPGIDVPLLGDLAICAPVVSREAIEQNKPLRAHWAHMLVHGTLHLLGYDHIDDSNAEQMERLETEILAHMNFPAPYDDLNRNEPV